MDDPELASWYPLEVAKRAFGRLCRQIDEAGRTVRLGGTPSLPLLELAPAKIVPVTDGEVSLSIDEAKAEWSAVTTACSIYGTQFRIRGRRVVRAVLRRHPTNRHPAERFLRSASSEAERIADELTRLALEIRKLAINSDRSR